MWITSEVEIPDALIEALTDGRLVIFAGAGVSRGHPTNLPDFAGLAAELGREASVEPRAGEDGELERYLGRVADSGFPLHKQAVALIERATEPNSLHQAIIQLPPRPSTLRIVTTNFDRHLSACAQAEYGEEAVREYFAPALPLGDEFTGIVYLHGAVGDDPARLVLTDMDFSQAYLTRGWARQFLLDLFRELPVIFIGYSHNDTILRYLARGLSSGTNRYALIREEDVARFHALGITPILFPSVEGDNRYQALTDAVVAWARLGRMGLAQHEQRVRELTASPPPQTQPELDYARAVVRHPDRVSLFRRHAASLEWLAWITAESVFKDLFVAQPSDDASLFLAEWYAERYVISEPDSALGILYTFGGRLSPLLWRVIAWYLWAKDAPPEVRAKWLPHLLATAPAETQDFLEYMLVKSRASDEVSPPLLFDFLTEPQVHTRQNWLDEGLIAKPAPTIDIRGDLF